MRWAARRAYRLGRRGLLEFRKFTSARWILVFQMGKVGSISVATSLQKKMFLTPIFHIHMLSEKQTARMRDLAHRGIEIRKHLGLADFACEMRPIILKTNGARRKIISLVRDPVAQSVATTMSEFAENNPGIESHSSGFSPNEMPALHVFFAGRQDQEYNFIAPWFNTEIRDLFDIDVFAKPFPTEKGYDIYSSIQADLLVMRLEDLDRCHRQAIEEFLGLRKFKLVNTNRAEDKGVAYSRAYQEFKNTVSLPDILLDKLYRIPWVKHFYTEAEIERFRSRWRSRN